MIFRMSTGTAHSAADADRYTTFLDTRIFPELRALPGHRGAYLLRRQIGDHAEMVIITMWESIDAIRAFAGDDVEAAVFEPEARRLLPDRDERVKLYEVVRRPGGSGPR